MYSCGSSSHSVGTRIYGKKFIRNIFRNIGRLMARNNNLLRVWPAYTSTKRWKCDPNNSLEMENIAQYIILRERYVKLVWLAAAFPHFSLSNS